MNQIPLRCSFYQFIYTATTANFKSVLNTFSVVLETYSIYHNVRKHIVRNVSKFHKGCFRAFGDMNWFASPLLLLT